MRALAMIVKTIAISFALVFLCGCAALRLDVDVYKGALSDNEKIQTERLAVMAVGLRPLLVDLRDDLENRGREIRWEKGLKPSPVSGSLLDYWFDRSKDYYIEDFIHYRTDSSSYVSWRTLIDPQAVRVNAVLSLYKDIPPTQVTFYIERIRTQSMKCKEHIKTLEKIKRDWEKPLNNLSNKLDAETIEAAKRLFGIVGFDTVPGYHTDLTELRNYIESKMTDYVERNLNLLDNDVKIATQYVKKDSEIAENLASKLFPKRLELQKRFVDASRKRLKAYLALYDGLERIFISHLKLFVILNDESIGQTQTLKKLRYSTINNIEALFNERDINGPAINTSIGCEPSSVEKPLIVSNKLQVDTILTCPGVSINKLQELHVLATSGNNPYGFAPAPKASGEYFRIEPIRSGLQSLLNISTGTGFETGRLPEGLESLIDEYLTQTKLDTNSVQTKIAGQKLRMALIRFAQKILAIANNEVLLNQYARESTVESSGNVAREQKAPLVENIQIMQAVGNSILVQANELTYRDIYKAALEKQISGELKAINAVYAPPPKEILAMIIDRLADTQVAIDKREKQITTLEKQKSEKQIQAGDLSKQISSYENTKSAIGVVNEYWKHLETTQMNVETILAQWPEIKLSLAPFSLLAPNSTWEDVVKFDQNVKEFKSYIDGLTKGRVGIIETAPKLRIAAVRLKSILNLNNDNDSIKSVVKEVAKIAGNFSIVDNVKTIDTFIGTGEKAIECFDKSSKNQTFSNSVKQCKKYSTLSEFIADFKKLNKTDPPTDFKTYATKLSNVQTAVRAQWKTELEPKQLAISKELKQARDEKDVLDIAIKKIEEQIKPLQEGPTVAEVMAAVEVVLEKTTDTWTEGITPGDFSAVIAKLKRDLTLSGNIVALRALNKVPLNFPSVGVIDVPDDNDPRRALDQLISALTYQHARMVQLSGAGSDSAQRISESIETLRAHRSGLIYIRPASSFLRSSYPATALQATSEQGWDNMLTSNFFRSLPVVGNTSTGEERRRLKVFEEIDKQSWQTVNTVRLEGAGETNFAIYKDDIGNWSVKAYAAKPDKIIESAKGLALFSMGINTSLAGSTPEKTEGSATETQFESVQHSTLEKLHKKHKDSYDNKSKMHANEILSTLEDDILKSRILTRWQADRDLDAAYPDLENALETASVRLKSDAGIIQHDRENISPGNVVLRGLKALKRFYSTCAINIEATDLDDVAEDKKAVVRQQARETIRAVIRDELDRWLAVRKSTAGAYADAVAFIGEAAGLENSP